MSSTTDTASDTAAERAILEQLIADQSVIDAILSGTFKVVVLMQSVHLDWNWQVPNLQYYRQGTDALGQTFSAVEAILAKALDLLVKYSSTPSPGNNYPYSLAEVGFLMQFVERNPAAAARLAACAPWFSLTGGAIETPDNILPHGEAFIRTYLLTRLWAEKNVPNTLSDYAWLPDDFGHTPCLPITLEAMGLTGFGFGRCPGSAQGQNNGWQGPDLVTHRNVDFTWQTADGSATQAHYLQNGYSQGSATDGIPGLSVVLEAPMSSINFGGGNANSVKLNSPYIMVGFGGDFECPAGDALFKLARDWNTENPVPTNIYAVLGTFDQYMSLVAAWNARSGSNGLKTLASPLASSDSLASTFWGTPYWTGFYATGPEIKSLHQHATRALLAAESLGAIASLGPATWGTQLLQSNLDNAWLPVAISTSHNVLTACGPNPVTYGESLPMLRYAHDNAQALRRSLYATIANAIAPVASPQQDVVVFNDLGFTRSSVAEYRPDPSAGVSFAGVQSVTPVDDPNFDSPAFLAPDGVLHMLASIPSLGYRAFTLSKSASPVRYDAVKRIPSSGSAPKITLSNGRVTVEIETGTAQTSSFVTVRDPAAKSSVRHGLRIMSDANGGIFRFGTEFGNTFSEVTPATCTVTWLSSVGTALLDRERFSITLTTTNGVSNTTFMLEVRLAANAAYAEFAIEGSAASEQAVMAAFEIGSVSNTPIAGVQHGTPHYYNAALPPVPPFPPNSGQAGAAATWQPPYFIPTHEYVTFVSSAGAPLFSVYHAALHAWSVLLPGETATPMLNNYQALACLYRNAPNGPNGALGSDPWTHKVRYAIRIATNLQTSSLQPVNESRGFVTPLEAITPLTPSLQQPSGTATPLVSSYSLASVAGDAVVNAAKVGSRRPTISGPPHTDQSLVLRIFTLVPGTQVRVTVTPTAANVPAATPSGPEVTALTALEEPLNADQTRALEIEVIAVDTFTFVPQRALTTLQVSWKWSGLSVNACGK